MFNYIKPPSVLSESQARMAPMKKQTTKFSWPPAVLQTHLACGEPIVMLMSPSSWDKRYESTGQTNVCMSG